MAYKAVKRNEYLFTQDNIKLKQPSLGITNEDIVQDYIVFPIKRKVILDVGGY